MQRSLVAAVFLPLAFALREAVAQTFGGPCELYITITQSPPDPYYQSSANVAVAWGEIVTEDPICLESGGPDPATFRFTVNGQLRTLTVSGTGASGSVSMPNGLVTLVASIEGYDAEGNFVELSYTKTTNVNAGATAMAPFVDVQSLSAGGLVERDLCLTIGAGSDAAYECGDLRIVHALPSVRTLNRERTPTLLYNSQHANPWPLVAANVTVPPDARLPDSVTARLLLGVVERARGSWPGWYWGVTRRLSIGFDARTDTTGRYGYSLVVQSWYGGTPYPTTATGEFVVLNRGASVFGAGWWLAGLEQLNTATMMWVGGDGSVRYYRAAGTNLWVADGLDRPDTLKWDAVALQYVRLLPQRLEVRFNQAGQHVATVNRLGHRTSFAYDAAGRVDSILLPPTNSNSSYKFTYDGNGRLASVRAPGNRTVTITPSSGRIQSIRDPDLTTVSFGFDPVLTNRIKSRTDRRGTVTTYLFGAGNKLVGDSIAMGTGQAPLVTRFSPAEIAGLAGASGAVDTADVYTQLDGPRTDVADLTRFWLDRYGAPARILDAVNNSTELWRRDGLWPALVTRVRYANGRVLGARYDNRGNIIEVTDSSRFRDVGGTLQYATTRYEWEAGCDLVRTITLPLGETVRMGYDPQCSRTWQEDGRGLPGRVSFYYGNGFTLLSSIQRPLAGARDSFSYDGLGNLQLTRTPNNVWVRYTRDALGRPTALDRSDSTRDSLAYDAAGRDTLFRQTGPYNEFVMLDTTWGLSFFRLPWPSETTVVRKSYDAEGNLLSLRRYGSGQPVWLATTWVYDRANRPARETAPDLVSDSFAYDLAGNRTLWLTRRGHAITMQYDAANRLTRRVVPLVVYPQEEFEDSVFPRPELYGSSLVIESDTAQYGYDPMGNVIVANNRYAHVVRSYNADGTLSSETQTIRTYNDGSPAWGLHEYRLFFSHDLDGRRLTMTLPSQLVSSGVVRYHYDSVGDLDSLVGPGGAAFRLHYDLEGRLDSLFYPNSVIQTQRYDADGRLSKRRSESLLGASSGFTGGVIRDDSLFYSRSRITSVLGSGGEYAVFFYTGLGHLGFTEEGAGSLAYYREWWKPDALGNVVKHWRQTDYDGFSQVDSSVYDQWTLRLLRNGDLSNDDWWWLSPSVYDAAGNEHLMARYRRGVYCTSSFGDAICSQWSPFFYREAYARYYSADNRLRVVDRRTATSEASTMAGGLEEFRYDALGRRVLRRFRSDWVSVGDSLIRPAEMVRYVWDGDQILHEIRAQGSDTSNLENDTEASKDYGRVLYLHGPTLDQPLMVMRTDPYWGQLYLHPDWRGRLVAGTWPSGVSDAAQGTSALVNWAARRPSSYGERRSRFRERDPAFSYYTWMGSFLDWQRDGTEQVYMRNRYYDPVSGRFTQEDPIGLAGGLNLYGFANGDPVNFSDPFGLRPDCCTGIVEALRAWWRDATDLNQMRDFAEALAFVPVVGVASRAPRAAAGVRSTAVAIPRVIGSFPQYLERARELGARAFGVPKRIWDTWSAEQRWAANQRFLDRGIRAGAEFVVTTAREAIQEGTTLAREVRYLLSHGYRWVEEGNRLIPR